MIDNHLMSHHGDKNTSRLIPDFNIGPIKVKGGRGFLMHTMSLILRCLISTSYQRSK